MSFIEFFSVLGQEEDSRPKQIMKGIAQYLDQNHSEDSPADIKSALESLVAVADLRR